MSKDLRERLRACTSLPTLPAAALCVLQLSQNDATGLDELSDVITKDSALSSKILRAINSSFYAMQQRVGTIKQAVPLLGLHSVKTLVLGFSLVSEMRHRRPKSFNHLNYWRRSMYAATAARVIAQKVLPERAEECFVAALLMDLGALALDQLIGDTYSAIHEKARGHSDLLILELHTLGMTHAEAGGFLGEYWKLPEALRVPIANHHSPQAVTEENHRAIAEVISLAGRCADIFLDESAAESIAAVRKLFQERYKIDITGADDILMQIGQKTAQLASLFEVRLNEAANYDGIMAKASERLLELSLADEQTSGTADPANRRRAPRIRRDAKMLIIPCARGILSRPLQVRLKDISASGIGVIHSDGLAKGSQFIVQLPAGGGQIKSLLYTVARCESSGGLYSIGGELVSVLRPNNTDSAPAANAAAA